MARIGQVPVQILNQLIADCKDSEKGFRDAAGDVRDRETKQLLVNFARERAEFVASLQEQVQKLGGSPQRSGSMFGTIHRNWMNFRAILNRYPQSLILQECERGEEVTLKDYEEALERELPQDIKAVVEEQFVHIIEDRNRLTELLP